MTARNWQELFNFYSEIPPQGGGTLLLEGSHRLVTRFFEELSEEEAARPTKAQKPRFAKRFPWFEELNDPAADRDSMTQKYLGSDFSSEGVRLKISEVVGKPGDAFLTHPHIIHAIAPHHGTSTRIQRVCPCERVQSVGAS